MAQLTIDLPESIPAEEARLEMAIGLYRSGRVTQGEAARVAGYTRPTFIELLAKRGVPFTNIDVADLDQELATWRSLASPTAPP
jgi:predicted HTH domain antitoxin